MFANMSFALVVNSFDCFTSIGNIANNSFFLSVICLQHNTLFFNQPSTIKRRLENVKANISILRFLTSYLMRYGKYTTFCAKCKVHSCFFLNYVKKYTAHGCILHIIAHCPNDFLKRICLNIKSFTHAISTKQILKGFLNSTMVNFVMVISHANTSPLQHLSFVLCPLCGAFRSWDF